MTQAIMFWLAKPLADFAFLGIVVLGVAGIMGLFALAEWLDGKVPR